MASPPLSETMKALLDRQEKLRREIDQARVSWRQQRDHVAELERDYKVHLQQELAKLAGEGDAHYRKVTAEAELAEEAYQLDLARSLKGSAYAAYEDRVEEFQVLKSAFNAYNRELKEGA